MTQNEALIYSESLDEDPDEGPGNGTYLQNKGPSLIKEQVKEIGIVNVSTKDQIVVQKTLVNNFVGNSVQLKDINSLFWTYASIGQDVFVSPDKSYIHVRLTSSHQISLFDYLVLLSYIRLSLSDFIQGISSLKIQAKDQISPSVRNNFNSPSTSYDTEQYYDEFKKTMSPLYEKAYPEKTLSHYKKDLYLGGKIDPARVLDFLAKISYYPQKESLFNEVFSSVDMSQIVTIENVQISLGDFIAIVRSLHISLHVFSPDYKI